jgi:hypothetical protein
MAGELVYHFASTAHLPWILECGELRPGPNKIGGYPIDFLWATTNAIGSRTATALAGRNKDFWRNGSARLVRFTLPADAFSMWPEILKRFPQWTPDHIGRLESSARDHGDTDISAWRCRADPLALNRDIQIDTRAYDGDWRPLTQRAPVLFEGKDDVRGILIDDVVYVAERRTTKPGSAAYQIYSPIRHADLVKAGAREIKKTGTG